MSAAHLAEVMAHQIRVALLAALHDQVVEDEVGAVRQEAEQEQIQEPADHPVVGQDLRQRQQAGPRGAREHRKKAAPHAAFLQLAHQPREQVLSSLLLDLLQSSLL